MDLAGTSLSEYWHRKYALSSLCLGCGCLSNKLDAPSNHHNKEGTRTRLTYLTGKVSHKFP